jgi:SpoIID/LytB domain protein
MVRLRTLSLLAAISVLSACAVPRTPVPASLASPEVIRVRTGGRVAAVPLEDYVLGSALSEVSPVNAPAAAVPRVFEVQAILARTYAVRQLGRHRAEGFDLCDTTHCQLYEPQRIGRSRFTAAAKDAVQRTRGVVLIFARDLVEALYHSDCGGHTASAGDVWGHVHVPYLVGTPDHAPALTHRTWQFDAPAAHCPEPGSPQRRRPPVVGLRRRHP